MSQQIADALRAIGWMHEHDNDEGLLSFNIAEGLMAIARAVERLAAAQEKIAEHAREETENRIAAVRAAHAFGRTL